MELYEQLENLNTFTEVCALINVYPGSMMQEKSRAILKELDTTPDIGDADARFVEAIMFHVMFLAKFPGCMNNGSITNNLKKAMWRLNRWNMCAAHRLKTSTDKNHIGELNTLPDGVLYKIAELLC
jgi:hypothetical protein